ncbi:hypothetical protein QBC37DRAFT_324543 [Rhypophila decipiens]|uniref:Rhodopsin domain-containing protein n=1 Tax=Rhypophila decipiens TaxID=261697 RepID=A0AAN6XY48_9PEZI|nr:hypothetical protein QBC37DRAFT_324543 [Rhypophila decipiens]
MAGAGPGGPPPSPPPELFLIDDGPRLIRILTSVTVLATLIVLLRIGLRLKRRVGIGLDDYLIILAMVITWATCTIAILFVSLGGLGRPLLVNLAIDPNRLTINQKLLFSGEIIYPTAIAITKYSILAMYWRIFPTQTVRLGTYILGGMTTAWWLAVCLVAVFQCTPQGKVFNPLGIEGTCIDNNDFFLGNSIPNIITDVAILCLPTYEVGKLHLPKSQRVALGLVFLLGAGVIVASSVRLHFHIVLAKLGPTADFTTAMFDPVLWTVLEPDMAVICASLPALRPLLTGVMNSSLFLPLKSYFSSGRSGSGWSGRARSGTVVTIGGSEGGLSKGGAKLSKNNVSCGVSSQEQLHHAHSGDAEMGLWPEGYSYEQKLKVTTGNKARSSSSAHIGPDDIPLEAIGVRTVVDWQETKGHSAT